VRVQAFCGESVGFQSINAVTVADTTVPEPTLPRLDGVARRALRPVRGGRFRHHSFNIDDLTFGIDEGDRERYESVLHPHHPQGLVVPHEQHAGVLAQLLPPHQPTSLFPVRDGDFHRERVRTNLEDARLGERGLEKGQRRQRNGSCGRDWAASRGPATQRRFRIDNEMHNRAWDVM